nr:hypothetical protein CFP56_06082 [Quercus suber]
MFRLAIKHSQGMPLLLGALFLGCLYSELDQLHYNELAGPLYHIVDSKVSIVMLQAFAWERSRNYINFGKSVSDIRDTKRVILLGIVDGEERFFRLDHGLPLLMKWMALKVWGLLAIDSLDTASDFIWRPYAYHADRFFSPSPFPCARPDSQMFNIGDDSKVLNFLIIISPSSLPCLSSSGFSLVKYNPHRVSRQFGLDQDVPTINDMEYDVREAIKPLLYDLAMDYWCEREVDVLIPCRRREGRVVYGENVPIEWSRHNRIVEAPKPKAEECKARNGTPPTGSVARRTRSKGEHDIGSSKRDRSKSPVIELHDSPVRDTSLSLTTSAVETMGPPFVPTTESSDSERTQSEDRRGDFMDITMGFDNLLLLVSLSSYAFAVDDGISIIGNVADPSMVQVETMEIGEAGTVIDPSPVPSASIVETGTNVPPLVLEEVNDGRATGEGATNSLLPPEGVAVVEGEPPSAAFQGVNVQDFMEMFDQERENDKSTEDFYTFSRVTVKLHQFDVPIEGLPLLEKVLSKHPDFMSRCTYGNAVRKVMFQSLVVVLLDIEHTSIKSFNLHKVLEWKAVLSELC